jgi:hypothetical protein
MALVKLLRYPDLKDSGYVTSRTDLGRKKKYYGFPLGKLLAPNTRAWEEPEVLTWWNNRPVEREPDATPREQRFGAYNKAKAQPTEPTVPPKAARRAAAKSVKVEAKRTAPKRKRRGR